MFCSKLIVMSTVVFTLVSAHQQLYPSELNYQFDPMGLNSNGTDRRCYWDTDCGLNGRCISNKCICRMGYKRNQMESCIQMTCSSNWDCIQEFGSNTRCGIGACQCALDYYLDQNTQKCVMTEHYEIHSKASIVYIIAIAIVPIAILIMASIFVFALKRRRNAALKKLHAQQAIEQLANGEKLESCDEQKKEAKSKEDNDDDNHQNNRSNLEHRSTSPSAPSDNILFQQPMPHYNPHYIPSPYFQPMSSNPVPQGPTYQPFIPHPGHVQHYYPHYNYPQSMMHPSFAPMQNPMYNGYTSVPLYPSLPVETNTETRYVPVESQTKPAPDTTVNEMVYWELKPENTDEVEEDTTKIMETTPDEEIDETLEIETSETSSDTKTD